MDLREHATMMGKLLVSFQCLEYALRAFLYERRDPPHEPLAPGTDLDTMTFGDVLPENAVTRWDSLTYLIKRYNRAISDGQLAVDPSPCLLGVASRYACSANEASFRRTQAFRMA
jgi:hypothetical protein